MREPSKAENARRELWADRENHHRQTVYRQAYAAWVHEDQVYGWMLQAARSGVGFAPEQVGSDFVPKRGETLFGLFNGCTLLEVKRAPGTVRAAFSNLIGLGADLKPGSVSAIIERSADEPTLTDEGEVVVTSRRVVLKGRHRVSDWKYRHLVAVQHDPARPISYVDTGHRHLVTGIGYPANQSALFRFALDLGVTLATGASTAPLIAAMEFYRAEHSRRPPAPPSMATPEGAPAGGRKVLGVLLALLIGRPGQSGGRRILHGTLVGTALMVFIAGASALATPPSRLAVMEGYANIQATVMPSTPLAPSNVTSPSVTPSPGPASTPSLTPTPTPTPTSSPTVTPSSTPTLTATPTPTAYTVPGDEPVDKFSAGPKPKSPKLLRTDADSVRVGAVCKDGSTSGATGRGACSWHDGVARWLKEKPYWVQEHKATNAKRQKAYKAALKEWTVAAAKNQLMAKYPCSKGTYKEGSAGYKTWRDSNGDGIACQPL